MLQLINVCKSYPIHYGGSMRQLLDHVNVTVRPSEKRGIRCRNGADKPPRICIMSRSDRLQSDTIRKPMSVSWPLPFLDAIHGSLSGKDNARLISRLCEVDFQWPLDTVESFAERWKLLRRHQHRFATRYAYAKR